jgi:hypothetical protein
MNALVPSDDRPKRQIIEVQDPIPVLDTSRFEHMQRIATVMARGTLLPESLYKVGNKDNKDNKEVLPLEQVISNCFLVVNQAVRWGLDPFAVAQSVAVVHGKLCYEGKLVAAVLDAKIGLRLHHHFVGTPGNDDYRIYLSDRPFDTEISVAVEGVAKSGPISDFVKPGFRHPAARLFDGSVGEWKTTGANTPWSPKNQPRMLVYRGTRDWTRIYEPAIMLGVYTPDEMMDLEENARAQRAREATPSVMQRLQARQEQAPEAPLVREGFDPAFVSSETSALTGEPPIEPNTSGDLHDVGSGGPVASPDGDAAADLSAQTGDEGEAGQIEAGDGPAASPASSELSDEQRSKLFLLEECAERMIDAATYQVLAERADRLDKARMAWLSELPDDKEFVQVAYKACTRLIENPGGRDQAMPFLKDQARKWMGVAA